MEKFALTLQSAKTVNNYLANNTFWLRYEKDIMAEIAGAIDHADEEKLIWFNDFGDDLRHILMNVNEYRKGIEFGFTEIVFGQSGWLVSPKFLDYEEIVLEASSIRIGRGPNGLWAYALRCSYGSAGSSSPLSVFCKPFPNRDAAKAAALAELKADMRGKIGNSDRSNYNPGLIAKTLKAISAAEIGLVQLSLF